jgi:hypothetical protein
MSVLLLMADGPLLSKLRIAQFGMLIIMLMELFAIMRTRSELSESWKATKVTQMVTNLGTLSTDYDKCV